VDKGCYFPNSADFRSLIALALIMSLLQFKPAPMYILDEVDAALDLSHTQNIGRLIKTRFKGY
jgi:structural maintenance of chromosome 2